MQPSWRYYLYDSSEDTQVAKGHGITCGKWGESDTIIFPLVVDRPVMKSMPHLLKRGTAVSIEDHSLDPYPWVEPQGKERHVIHGECQGI